MPMPHDNLPVFADLAFCTRCHRQRPVCEANPLVAAPTLIDDDDVRSPAIVRRRLRALAADRECYRVAMHNAVNERLIATSLCALSSPEGLR